MCKKQFVRPRLMTSGAVPRDHGHAATTTVRETLTNLSRRRHSLEMELARLDAELDEVLFTYCGADDSIDVEQYHGGLDVSEAFVDQHERPVGMLYCPIGGGFGTGAMISEDLFLTARHNFKNACDALHLPSGFGFELSFEEIAASATVVFNHQLDPFGRRQRAEEFPIVGLAEPFGALDYAIIVLGRNERGLPGELYGHLTPAVTDLTTKGATLCIIQHPDGKPKRVHAGPLRDNDGLTITYDTIDTSGESSGAPILDGSTGMVVGVHTDGGCDGRGYNSGIAIGAIRNASDVI